MHRVVVALAAVALCSACATLPAPATSPSAGGAGLGIAERSCAGCHAVGVSGESRNPDAPTFRRLARERPDADLRRAIAQISQHGHVEMPPIYVTPQEQGELVVYLRSLRGKA